MPELKQATTSALAVLIGLRMCIAKNTGDLRAFHFGRVQRTGATLSGEYALHLSCPWRIESTDTILTGSGDYYERADDNKDPAWEVGMPWGTYQQQVLTMLLGGVDSQTGTLINNTDLLEVEAIATDSMGGAIISLSGDYRLVLFPSSARGEQWRLLPPDDAPHVVVEAGQVFGRRGG
jgi:hypothetical protein